METQAKRRAHLNWNMSVSQYETGMIAEEWLKKESHKRRKSKRNRRQKRNKQDARIITGELV